MGLLVLIFDSSRALEGARSGLELCMKSVIPSLFPFFVLSMLLTGSPGQNQAYPLRLLYKALGIPKSAQSILIPAFLGGYPVGAKCVGAFYQRKQIHHQEAERLLAFCSNAGPAFLFGMVSVFFPERHLVWLLWFIHVFSAVLTAAAIPAKTSDSQMRQPDESVQRTSVIWPAAKAMCQVCCWVILFRIVITFLDAWFLWILPKEIRTVLVGILELTNGCCELMQIPDVKQRFIICSCMLAFGGICVLLQTASVTQGLSLGCYLKGKLLQTMFSFLLSCTVMLEKGLVFAVWIPVLLLLFRKKQNKYGNPEVVPV